MLKHTELARRLAARRETFLAALKGRLYGALDGASSLSALSARQFERYAQAELRETHTALIEELRRNSDSIAHEARSQALSDAQSKRKPSRRRADTKRVEAQISAQLSLDAASAAMLFRKCVKRHKVLMVQGLTFDSARIRARELFRRELGRTALRNRAGQRMSGDWALYLMIADHLNSTRYESYIEAAVELGFEEFVIVQPGHRRDGFRFHADYVPHDELHPQSAAVIKIWEETV